MFFAHLTVDERKNVFVDQFNLCRICNENIFIIKSFLSVMVRNKKRIAVNS